MGWSDAEREEADPLEVGGSSRTTTASPSSNTCPSLGDAMRNPPPSSEAAAAVSTPPAPPPFSSEEAVRAWLSRESTTLSPGWDVSARWYSLEVGHTRHACLRVVHLRKEDASKQLLKEGRDM